MSLVGFWRQGTVGSTIAANTMHEATMITSVVVIVIIFVVIVMIILTAILLTKTIRTTMPGTSSLPTIVMVTSMFLRSAYVCILAQNLRSGTVLLAGENGLGYVV